MFNAFNLCNKLSAHQACTKSLSLKTIGPSICMFWSWKTWLLLLRLFCPSLNKNTNSQSLPLCFASSFCGFDVCCLPGSSSFPSVFVKVDLLMCFWIPPQQVLYLVSSSSAFPSPFSITHLSLVSSHNPAMLE